MLGIHIYVGTIAVPVVEANLLRNRLRNLLSLREEFLANPQQETIHDLSVASRRARELLDYLHQFFLRKSKADLMTLCRRITKGLGAAREAEVNLAILTELSDERKIDPVAAELLFHFQKLRFRKDIKRQEKEFHIRNIDFLISFF